MTRPANPKAKLALLKAAEHEFVARGLDGAKVETMTAAAGMSKGAFYLHFASKEDAFREIVETLLGGLGRLIEDFPRPGQLRSLDEYLERWIEQDVLLFDFLWQHRGVVRLMLEGGKSATFSHLADEFAERARQTSLLGLAEGKALGLFRADLDLELGSLFLSGAYDRVARHMVRLARRPNLEEWMKKLQRFALSGLGASAMVAPSVPASPQVSVTQRPQHAAARRRR